MQARTALVRRVGNAVQRDHLAGVALKGGLGGGTTDLLKKTGRTPKNLKFILDRTA